MNRGKNTFYFPITLFKNRRWFEIESADNAQMSFEYVRWRIKMSVQYLIPKNDNSLNACRFFYIQPDKSQNAPLASSSPAQSGAPAGLSLGGRSRALCRQTAEEAARRKRKSHQRRRNTIRLGAPPWRRFSAKFSKSSLNVDTAMKGTRQPWLRTRQVIKLRFQLAIKSPFAVPDLGMKSLSWKLVANWIDSYFCLDSRDTND